VSVPSQCEVVNPVRSGRKQRQQRMRVPGCGWRGLPPSYSVSTHFFPSHPVLLILITTITDVSRSNPSARNLQGFGNLEGFALGNLKNFALNFS